MGKRRTLTPQEKALWAKVAESAKPLKRVSKPEPVGPQAVETPTNAPNHDMPHAHGGAHRGVVARPTEPSPPQADWRQATASAPPPASLHNLDGRTADRMRRGKLSIDGRIDLHGMTRPEAHSALNRFIIDSHQRGARMVLVITGKGRGRSFEGNPLPVPDMPWERKAEHRFQMPTYTGVLREEVPQWLRQPPIGALVVAATEAQPKHGGYGALYVYLRRER